MIGRFLTKFSRSNWTRCASYRLRSTTPPSFQEMNASEKRKYLETWLGKDMAGDRYLNQVVSASKNKTNHPIDANVPKDKFVQATTTQIPITAISSETVHVPVVTIDWSKPSELVSKIESFEGKLCAVDFSGSLVAHVNDMQQLLTEVKTLSKIILAVNVPLSLKHLVVSLPFVEASSPVITNNSNISNNNNNNNNNIKKQDAINNTEMDRKKSNRTLIHTGTVRSGQQIYSEEGSAVVIGSVNDGAEVLADGDVHIYGQLYGRVVAGLDGKGTSGIFAKQFNPSLIGISEAFIMVDDCQELKPFLGRSVYVKLVKTKPLDVVNSNTSVVLDCDNNNYLIVSTM